MFMLICLISHIKVKLGNSCVLMFTAVALQSLELDHLNCVNIVLLHHCLQKCNRNLRCKFCTIVCMKICEDLLGGLLCTYLYPLCYWS